MASGFVIRKNQYYDSLFLMGISKRISGVPGVQQNAVLMGSEANKILLRDVSKRLSNLEIEFVGSGDPLPVLSGIEVLRAETKARQVAGR